MLEALTLARVVCSPSELKEFTAGVAAVLGELELSLASRIYGQHPDLREPLPNDSATLAAIERIQERFRGPKSD